MRTSVLSFLRRRHRSLCGLSLLAALSACSAAKEEPAPSVPPRVGKPAATPAAMAPFERMIGGEWKMTVSSGTSSYRTWHWGPGRFSARVMTSGEDAAGKPWRDLQVFYWHPGRKQVREFGVSQFARGVTDGTISFEGAKAQSDFDLYQVGGRRRLRTTWEFAGPDAYRATLLEASPPDSLEFTAMVAWDLVRAEAPTAPRPVAVEGATGPSAFLRPLGPLLGAWETKSDGGAAGGLHIQAAIEWIPLADAIYARVLAPDAGGEPTHLLDLYLYHHTGTGAMRALALSSRGEVYEGDIAALEGGALEVELKGREGDRDTVYLVRVDFSGKSALRLRAWSINGTERTPVLDLHPQKL